MKSAFGAYLFFALVTAGSAAEPTVKPVAQVLLRAAGGGATVALWQQVPNPNKPYIAQLFAPGEMPIPLLVDSPVDHFHHHGLMFALQVDGTDFWAEKDIKNAGRQEVMRTVVAPAGDGFSQDLRWLSENGTNLLDEARSVRVRVSGKGADAVHWLDWESALSPAAGRNEVRLSGAHYFGLGMRFVPEWANQGEFIWADAAVQNTVRGDEKLTFGDWCAVRSKIGGRMVTVLMVADAANPRPGEWFTMSRPFCYLSATLNLKKAPAVLAKGQSWKLRYGLAILSTPADHARLAAIAADWRATRAASMPSTQISTQQ